LWCIEVCQNKGWINFSNLWCPHFSTPCQCTSERTGSNRECRDRWCQRHLPFNTASTREYMYFTKSLFIDNNVFSQFKIRCKISSELDLITFFFLKTPNPAWTPQYKAAAKNGWKWSLYSTGEKVTYPSVTLGNAHTQKSYPQHFFPRMLHDYSQMCPIILYGGSSLLFYSCCSAVAFCFWRNELQQFFCIWIKRIILASHHIIVGRIRKKENIICSVRFIFVVGSLSWVRSRTYDSMLLIDVQCRLV